MQLHGSSAALFLLPLLGATLPAQKAPLDHLIRLEDGRTRRISSSNPDFNSNRDNLRVKPGKTHTLAEIKDQGPGVIRHIWLTFPHARPSWLARQGGARPDEIVLRMYWDGAVVPAVEVPVGDFFAAGFGRRAEVRSAVVQVEDGDSYNCYWPMPFYRSARITLTNESEKPLNSTYFYVDYETKPKLPERTPLFYAQYRQAFPAPEGQDLLVADIEGEGHYVGTVLSVRTRSPQWFGEGDDRFYIDGESQPSLRGTGTEDYFLSAWGLKENTFPYSGTPIVRGSWGHIGQQTTAYRWHLLDPIRFSKSLRFTIEHKGWVDGDEKPDGKVHGHTERFDDFATVAFWYQVGKAKPFPKLPHAKERVPPNLDWIVEGRQLLAGAKTKAETAKSQRPKLQKGYSWTGDGQIFFPNKDEDAWLELAFEVEQEEYRALVLPLTRSYDYGIFRILLDGKIKRKSIDLFDEETKVEEISLGSATLSKGKHTLRFQVIGKNPLSSGYYLGLDSVRLRQRLPPR